MIPLTTLNYPLVEAIEQLEYLRDQDSGGLLGDEQVILGQLLACERFRSGCSMRCLGGCILSNPLLPVMHEYRA